MNHMLKTLCVTAQMLGALALAAPAFPQAARDARLVVTVVDPSGGVIPGATVTAAGQDDTTRAAAVRPATTTVNGVATIDALLPGRYSIEAEFGGFEKGVLKDVRLRRGDNKQVVVLGLKNVQESVTVAQDAQAAAADPRGNAFKTALTVEEIAALSDDPAEMAQQLQEMAGGTAVIRVDSFAGGPLPPKALIKSIHIVRDAFAAENHSAESEEIDIITQPGSGALRANVSSRVRDASLNARSPFTPTKGAERSQSYEGNIGGTLVRNKSSFSLSVESRSAFDTPIINVALPSGNRSEVLNIHRPNDNWSLYGLIDYALTRDQTMRLSYDQSNTTRKNLGLGGFDYLPERAYDTASQDHEFRAQVVGPFGRRTFANTRVQMTWLNTVSQSAVELPTVRVFDSATSGGAQVVGGRHPKDLEFASDVDYVRGMNTVRVGVLVDGGRYRSDDATNYLGTYTFTSLDALKAGRPSLYTRRIGDPLVRYWNMQAGAYVQNDIRVRKNLTLSPGLRYEAQTHLNDRGNFGPRFGLTWAPFKNGKTTVRGSVGTFYNWMNSGTYEQTLRVNGFRQRELNIVNPPYPDPGDVGTITTANRYVLGDDVEMSRTFRVSAGIDRTLTQKVRVNASYSRVRALDVLRGRNLNAPVTGVRPDTAFANEIEVVSDARSVSHQLSTTLNVNFAGGMRNASQPRWNWHRSTVRFSYWIAKAKNNTDGAFSAPASGTLDTEWGPTPGDRRHRMSASLSTQALRNLNASLTLAANTGTPYTITTGLDNNGDSIFNDRPAGIGRNSVRTPGQSTLSANLSYSVGIGAPRLSTALQERGGGRAAPAAGRYRLSFILSATNLTNRPNYAGFSGVMTSPFFRTATSVTNPRRVELGASLRF
jgi:hypothetical protein